MPREEPSKLAATVRRRIREIRVERGLTQAQVCERAGISIDAVTRIESGRRQPELRTIELLAIALGVAPTAFFEGAPEARSNPVPVVVRRMVALIESLPDDAQLLAEGVLSGLVRAVRRARESRATVRGKRRRAQN